MFNKRWRSMSEGTSNSKLVAFMSSDRRSRSPASFLRFSYRLKRSSSCSSAALTFSHRFTRSGFNIARSMFLFRPAVKGSHRRWILLHASNPLEQPITKSSGKPDTPSGSPCASDVVRPILVEAPIQHFAELLPKDADNKVCD